MLHKNTLKTTISALFVVITIIGSASSAFAAEKTAIEILLEDSPRNWDKWGEDDQIGALNYLDEDQVKRGIKAVKTG